jgi:hypothetical protein
MRNDELIHISVPASEHDPRNPLPHVPGIVIHYVPDLHPDDVEVVNGLRVTSLARTLIDLGEDLEYEELLATFYRARDMGQLDLEKLVETRARVEWRPSLEMVDEVIAEFLEDVS